MNESDLLTIDVSSSLLGVSKQTLRRWDESGRLKAVRGENDYRYYSFKELLKHLPKDKARPFVKWAGGKTQLLPYLLSHVPATYKRYVEPFVGGGALFFTLQPKKALLNDSNPELINAYQVIKHDPDELVTILERYQKQHNRTFYYKIRAQDFNQLAPSHRAARFIYLNKTCFNGLFRVNKLGQFNVPIGSYKNPNILDIENIFACSQALQQAELFCMDYVEFLNKYAKKDDFIYLDPPYLPISKYSDFDRYAKEKFRVGNHIELALIYQKLVDNGSHPILSNSDSIFTEKLYASFKLDKVMASRYINKDAEKRGKIKEIVVHPTQHNADRFPSTRYMGSKNNLLPYITDIIAKTKAKTVLDAFSGSGVVSYHFKRLGYTVYANDFLTYSACITKALIENNSIVLTAQNIQQLLQKNRRAKTFIQKTFKGLYFSDDDNKFLDNTMANLLQLTCEYKKAIALAALSRACLKRRPRGIFTYVGFRYDDGRKDLSYSLQEHFLFSVAEFNQAVFSNKRKNRSYNSSILELDCNKPDLVYMDPPYFSKHSDNDYVRRYHFIEGLCRNWQGLEIQQHTKTRKFKKYDSPFNSKEETYNAFDWMFEKYQRSAILISYSSNSLPEKDELIAMLSKYKSNIVIKEIDYRYSFGNQGHKKNDNNNAVKEYLFLAT